METQRIAAAAYRPILRRLDYCPVWLALPVGLGAGVLGAVAVLTWTPAVVGAALFVLLLGGAALLAWSGEPVASLEQVPAPAPPMPGLEMVRIPGGMFRMGSPADETGRFDNEGPVHTVRVSDFEMMRVPVTRRLYQAIMQPDTPIPDADERPMTEVSWLEAMQFCNRLSEHQGCAPCYRIDGHNVQWQQGAQGYRLPTEAEWEYACRAGTQSRFFCGDDERMLERYVWYAANSQGAAQPVGRKAPNPGGLFDMHGNVWEWCWDWYGPYDEHPQTDPTGPLEGRYRVVRGGSFVDSPGGLRSAFRVDAQPERRDACSSGSGVCASPQLESLFLCFFGIALPRVAGSIVQMDTQMDK
jgi:formylglycine-generating enzyme required for sulfatase activity